MPRIGPKMAQAADYVARNPGCAKLPVAKRVGPHGSSRYGYRTVNRAIRTGLIIAKRWHNGVYSLYPPVI